MLEVATTGRSIHSADFPTMMSALDYAASAETGLNFYDLRGNLSAVVRYADLRNSSISLAGRLLAAGLEPGDRVALFADTTTEFVESFFACMYAGLIAAPLPLPGSLGWSAAFVQNIRRILLAAAARGILIPACYKAWFKEGIAIEGVLPLSLQDLPAAAESRLPQIKSADTCYLQFSSGSTRDPVGIVVSHQALMANIAGITRDGLQLRGDDRLVSWLPFYHDMGLVGFLLVPVATQMTVDLLPTAAFVRRPFLWLDIISRNGGTVSYSPTFGYELCLRRTEALSKSLDLSRWRIAGVGGDMVRAETLRAFAERFGEVGFRRHAFVASYGMAEATLALSFARIESGVSEDVVDLDAMEWDAMVCLAAADAIGARTRSFVRCGQILPGHEIQVRNDAGHVLPDRHVGRIFVRGPSIMKEYFRQPRATAEVLSSDGWLDTGDLGYQANGEITLTGRTKDLILVNGRNVWPQDIEWTVETGVDSVRSGDVAAISSSDDQQVIVLLQCRSRDHDVRSHLVEVAAALVRARHAIDVHVKLIRPHALPRTSSGKLSRSKARALHASGVFEHADEADSRIESANAEDLRARVAGKEEC